jgi:hypothetical protein
MGKVVEFKQKELTFPSLGDKVEYLSKVVTDGVNDYHIEEGVVHGIGYNKYGHPFVQVVTNQNMVGIELCKLDLSNKEALLEMDSKIVDIVDECEKVIQSTQEKVNKNNKKLNDEIERQNKMKIDRFLEEVSDMFNADNNFKTLDV